MLEVEGLVAGYGRTQVLWGVSFSVPEGKTVTLVGSNGAGKTTTLNAICGIVRATAGTVRFLGRTISHMPASRLVGMGLVQVPEGRELFMRMTVRENLELAAYSRRDGGVERSIRAAMDRFPVLGERQHQLAGTLSGGEQQMLAIARGLMARPRLLILDEPSWGLAPLIVESVFEVIRAIREEGTTIFLVEQNVAQALAIADHGYVLERGRIVLSGPAAELAANESVVQAYLGGRLGGSTMNAEARRDRGRGEGAPPTGA